MKRRRVKARLPREGVPAQDGPDRGQVIRSGSDRNQELQIGAMSALAALSRFLGEFLRATRHADIIEHLRGQVTCQFACRQFPTNDST